MLSGRKLSGMVFLPSWHSRGAKMRVLWCLLGFYYGLVPNVTIDAASLC